MILPNQGSGARKIGSLPAGGSMPQLPLSVFLTSVVVVTAMNGTGVTTTTF